MCGKKVMQEETPLPPTPGERGWEVKRRIAAELLLRKRLLAMEAWSKKANGDPAKDGYVSSSLNTSNNTHTRISVSK